MATGVAEVRGERTRPDEISPLLPIESTDA
jgi:hypothetical protein